jgi:hypothetical protein
MGAMDGSPWVHEQVSSARREKKTVPGRNNLEHAVSP